MTIHQQKQIEVIEQIEDQIQKNTLNFSTISPVEDFENYFSNSKNLYLNPLDSNSSDCHTTFLNSE